MVEMKRLAPLLALFFVAGVTFAQTPSAKGACQVVDTLNLSDPGRPDVLFTTPPYVALTPLGKLRQLANRTRPLRREVALTEEQVTCLENLTGTRWTAVRAGSSYRFKLQTSTGTLLIFHVADLVGGEAIVVTQGERLPRTTPVPPSPKKRKKVASAQGETRWKALMNQVRALYQQGKYREAVPSAKEALKVAEQTFGSDHPHMVQSLNNLGVLYERQGQYAKAEPLYKRALGILEKAMPNHPMVLATLERLAEMYIEMGKDEKAVPLLNRARKIRLGQ